MVNGVAALHAQFAAIPEAVRDEVIKAIEKIATEMVREMRSLAPIPEIAAGVNWTWGDAPKGTFTVASFKGRDFGRISATIYATAFTSEYPGGNGFPAIARWFEFGTAERFHKSGKYVGRIVAQPFFWPVYRANSRLFRNRVRAAVNRAVKRLAR